MSFNILFLCLKAFNRSVPRSSYFWWVQKWIRLVLWQVCWNLILILRKHFHDYLEVSKQILSKNTPKNMQKNLFSFQLVTRLTNLLISSSSFFTFNFMAHLKRKEKLCALNKYLLKINLTKKNNIIFKSNTLN